jgi:hypothetical protein
MQRPPRIHKHVMMRPDEFREIPEKSKSPTSLKAFFGFVA